MKLIARVNDHTDFVWISTDAGITWAPTVSDTSDFLSSIVLSADGTQLIGASYNAGSIWQSLDDGVSWTATQ